jgi:DNA-binding NarL/FixJ family response regulator
MCLSIASTILLRKVDEKVMSRKQHLTLPLREDELTATIRKVYAGEPFIQPKVASKLLMEFGRKGRLAPSSSASLVDDELSVREIEVLKLLAAGASNREIADKLVLAEGKVKNHVSNILSKLHAENRTLAANLARERKII